MTLQRPKKGYVYIPKEHASSVYTHGLMSVLQQIKHRMITLQDLKIKYGRQIKNALSQYPELKQHIKHSPSNLTIADFVYYLNWREEITERGADAIYLLYTPIPAQFIDEFGDFSDRTMYEVRVPNDWTVVEIGGHVSTSTLALTHTAKWNKIYKNAIALKKENPNALWFEGVPHFMIIPPSHKKGVLHSYKKMKV